MVRPAFSQPFATAHQPLIASLQIEIHFNLVLLIGEDHFLRCDHLIIDIQ